MSRRQIHNKRVEVMARIFLTAMFGLAGHPKEARGEASEMIRISPKFYLKYGSII